jgi:hypothetical protein
MNHLSVKREAGKEPSHGISRVNDGGGSGGNPNASRSMSTTKKAATGRRDDDFNRDRPSGLSDAERKPASSSVNVADDEPSVMTRVISPVSSMQIRIGDSMNETF